MKTYLYYVPKKLQVLVAVLGVGFGLSGNAAVPKFSIPEEVESETNEESASEDSDKGTASSMSFASEETSESEGEAAGDSSETEEKTGTGESGTGEGGYALQAAEDPTAEEGADDLADRSQPTDGSGAIVGQILDGSTGAFMESVYVVLERSDGAGTATDSVQEVPASSDSADGQDDAFYSQTNAQGAFVLEDVPPGTYVMSVVKTGYYEYRVTDIGIEANELERMDIGLEPKTEFSDEVFDMGDFVVTAETLSAGRAELMELRQNSVGMVDFLSVEDFAKFGGSSLADLVQRLSGVNVVEGQFAVVRGLGDRYNSTLVNGLPMPSPDPLRQGLQLDLFPTSIMESIVAEKAFLPHLPGNSSGAAFDLQTTRPPEDGFTGWVEFGLSVNDNTKDSLLLNDDAPAFRGTKGNSDISLEGTGALDDGSGLSGPLSKDRSGLQNNRVSATSTTIDDDILAYGGQSYKAGFGKRFQLPNEGSIGLITAFSYSSGSKTDIGIQQDRFATGSNYTPFIPGNTFGFPVLAGGPGSLFNKELGGSALRYDYTRSVVEELTGALVGLGADLDPEGNHHLDFTYLYAHSGISEVVRRENGFLPDGFDGAGDRGFGKNASGNSLDRGDAIVGRNNGNLYVYGSDSLRYENRTLNSRQYRGEHDLDFPGPFTFSWGYTSSDATSTLGDPDPDNFVPGQERLAYLRNVSGSTQVESGKVIEDGEYFFLNSAALADNFEAPLLLATAREITDSLEGGRFDAETSLWEGSKLKTGYFLSDTEREVVQRDELSFLSTFTEGRTTPEEVFDSPGGAVLSVQEINSFADTSQRLEEGYLSLDFKIYDRIEVTAGARKSKVGLESQGDAALYPTIRLQDVLDEPVAGNPQITNGELIGFEDAGVASKLNKEYLLPALSAKYDFLENWSLRGAFGETIAMPSMRELSPTFSTDAGTGDRILGNPNLQVSEIRNFSLRLERTFDDDSRIAVSVFHKTIEQPIEQIGIVYRGTGDAIQTFFNNPNDATVQGIELEGRIGLGRFHDSLEYLSLGGNVSFIEAFVGFPEKVLQTYFSGSGNQIGGPFVGSDGPPFGNDNLPEERRLFDQPEWTANVDLTFEQPDWGTRATLAFYAQSDVLTSVGSGSSLTVDQYTLPYSQVDLSFSQKFGEGWEFEFAVENLTDTERGITYSRELVDDPPDRQSFKIGRSYSASLKYSF